MDSCEACAQIGNGETHPATLEERICHLFEAQRTSIYRYLITLLGKSDEAEDVTQQAFLRLYEHLLDGHEVREPRSWIFQVAHNLAVDTRRERRFTTSGDGSFWDELNETKLDASLDLEERILASEQAERLKQAMLSLPAQQRACLLLRAEGFRYREVAKILGVSVSTVGESLRRGIRRLRTDGNV